MAINIELLKCMDDQHALNTLRADFDPLVSTPLEAFLIEWVESLVDTQDPELEKALDEYNLDAADINKLGGALIEDTDKTVAILGIVGEAGIDDADELKGVFALIEALDEAGIDTPETLKTRLALADQFRALANDAGDVFSRLTELTTGATA